MVCRSSMALCAAVGLLGCGLLLEPPDLANVDAAGLDAGVRPGGDDAGLDAQRADVQRVDGGCSPADETCAGGEETYCDPMTNLPATRPCAMGCDPEGRRCRCITPSNVDAALFDHEAPNAFIDRPLVFDTSTCMDALGDASREMQEDGTPVCVARARNVLVGPRGRLDVTGDVPLVVLVAGDLVMDGLVNVSAQLHVPGPGGFRGAAGMRTEAMGPSSGQPGTNAGGFPDGGGGGGGLCGHGGDGGMGGGSGAIGGPGAPALGGWGLVPLAGGSGGGLGGGHVGGGIDNTGHGGGGGGALQISACGELVINGEILAAGGGGGRGGHDGATTINYGAGGGGGSGGSVLLEASSIVLAGVINVGGGGGGGSSAYDAMGTDGEDGSGGAGTAGGGRAGSPMGGADGGAGAGGDVAAGAAAQSTMYTGGNGGGGGGGGGCVVFRTPAGVMPSVPGSVVPRSPAIVQLIPLGG